ncbi:MAG: 6-phosphofructokinase, partial [Ilumatobacteraceae bacterium]
KINGANGGPTPESITDAIYGVTQSLESYRILEDAGELNLDQPGSQQLGVMVVEVMGREAGWIAAYAGIAGGATVVLVPEEPFDIGEVCEIVERRHYRGRYASIVVVAEGARPIEGTMAELDYARDHLGRPRLGGISVSVASEIERRTGFEARVVQIGHVQRGGTPTAYDRILATRYGLAAVDAVHDGAWGCMVALRGTEVVRVPLTEVIGRTRTVDLTLLHDVAQVFYG